MLPCHACPSLWIDTAYISILQYRSVWHVSQNPLTLHALHACKGAKCKAMFLKHTDCSANDTHVKMPSCSKRPPLLWGSPRPSSVSATACSAVELLCTRLGLPTNAKVPKAAAKSARGTARDMILAQKDRFLLFSGTECAVSLAAAGIQQRDAKGNLQHNKCDLVPCDSSSN